MAYHIVLSDESRLDLREANKYYLAISIKLNTKFNLEIKDAIERIATNPEHFQERYRSIKIVFTKTFPFGIHYLVDESVIYIQRIMHQKRLYK